jgi:hypothetical protein
MMTLLLMGANLYLPWMKLWARKNSGRELLLVISIVARFSADKFAMDV